MGKKIQSSGGKSCREALCRYVVCCPKLPIFTVEGGDASTEAAQAGPCRGQYLFPTYALSKCRIGDIRLRLVQGLRLGCVVQAPVPGSHFYVIKLLNPVTLTTELRNFA